jgi:hypothetical protein
MLMQQAPTTCSLFTYLHCTCTPACLLAFFTTCCCCCCCAVTQRYLPKPLDAALLEEPLVSPVYMGGFDGLVRGQLLVIAGGCEGMTPDITR